MSEEDGMAFLISKMDNKEIGQGKELRASTDGE